MEDTFTKLFSVLISATAPLAGRWDVVGSFVAIIVAVLIARFSASRRLLLYEVIAASPLSNAASQKVRVTANGEALREPHLLILKIVLQGNKGIQRQDYNEPLRIGIAGPGVTIAAGTVQNRELTSWSASDVGYTSTVLETIPLNPGESVTVELVLDGVPSHIWVEGHILDCPILRRGRFTKGAWSVVFQAILWAAVPLFVLSILQFSARQAFFVYSALLAIIFTIHHVRYIRAAQPSTINGLKVLQKRPEIRDPRMWKGPEVIEKD